MHQTRIEQSIGSNGFGSQPQRMCRRQPSREVPREVPAPARRRAGAGLLGRGRPEVLALRARRVPAAAISCQNHCPHQGVAQLVVELRCNENKLSTLIFFHPE